MSRAITFPASNKVAVPLLSAATVFRPKLNDASKTITRSVGGVTPTSLPASTQRGRANASTMSVRIKTRAASNSNCSSRVRRDCLRAAACKNCIAAQVTSR